MPEFACKSKLHLELVGLSANEMEKIGKNGTLADANAMPGNES